MAKKTPKASASATYEVCTIYSTVPMTCLLCGAQVQPHVLHECGSWAKPKRSKREQA